MNTDDNYFMSLALEQAEIAFNNNEVPIGAIIVSSSNIVISSAHNTSEKNYSQSYHAEIKAIEMAGKKLKDWRLDNCTLYVTLQPCLMCLSLISLSRIERLVWGAKSPLFGYDLDKEILPDLYKKHIKGITTGILEEQAQLLLKEFFKNKRKKGEKLRYHQTKAYST